MSTVRLATRPTATITADALVVGLQQSGKTPAIVAAGDLPKDTHTHLTAAVATLGLTGALDETARLVAVPGLKASSVIITGLGKEVTSTSIRAAAGAATRALLGKAANIVIALPTSTADDVAAAADGAIGGAYQYEGRPRKGKALSLSVVSDAGTGKDVKSAVARANVVAARRELARNLVNLPPNMLNPATFADRAKAEAKASAGTVTVTVMEEPALRKAGCGGILGVGQASAVPPRIVKMVYKPAKAKASIALVGKGITFDTGGLRLKPIDGMATMKSDMGGAAAVCAAVLAAAELKLPVAVTGWLCLAENMIAGNAQRPSDVVTMRNGMTVEVLDPDAEGRMVLADGMALACEQKPTALVDIATLTGAQALALGKSYAAYMDNDDTFATRVGEAAQTAGESIWRMPLPQEYRASLDSAVADIAHKGEIWGGMLTAGLFLKEFVTEGTPWAHLDIASVAYNNGGPTGATPKGGTGYGVATLLSLIESYA